MAQFRRGCGFRQESLRICKVRKERTEYGNKLLAELHTKYFRSHLVGSGDLEVVQEIQVSVDEPRRDRTVGKGQVSIISTYERG